jgi:glucosyl-dolichyl phosphate glucuronosyltransferase
MVISSFNRCRLLAEAISHAIDQKTTASYEIIIVDNNSTDRTRELVESFRDQVNRVRYLFEPRQGVSYARNCGIAAARSDIVAFADDDVVVAPDWIETVFQTFTEHPEVGFLGGKVLPIWLGPPPKWLTRDHWMPLGIQDHGDVPFYLEASRSTGVVGANFAFRTRLFDRVGLFSPDVQLTIGRIGSVEDHEIVARMWRAGVKGFYVPHLVVYTEVPRERMTKRYHRRWHSGHGAYYSDLRDKEWETARFTLLGSPSHLYRQFAEDGIRWFKNVLLGDLAAAFLSEGRLRFCLGFFGKRLQESFQLRTAASS